MSDVLHAKQLLGALEECLHIHFVFAVAVVGAVAQARACPSAAASADPVCQLGAQHGGHRRISPRRSDGMGASACHGSAGAIAMEDGVAPVGGYGRLGMLWGGCSRRDGEEGALVALGVADQAGDVVVLQQGVGEDSGRGKAVG